MPKPLLVRPDIFRKPLVNTGKYLLSIFCLVIIFLATINNSVYSQISFQSSNYAIPGDSFMVSVSAESLVPAYNFNSTGTNYTWVFDTLSALTQQYKVEKDPDQTSFLSSFLFGVPGVSSGCIGECTAGGGGINACTNGCNLQWNQLTNAVLSWDTIDLQTFQVYNLYSFYANNGSSYEKKLIGYNVSVSGISSPLTTRLNSPDIVYKFPIAYTNKDSSESDYTMDLGLPFIYTHWQKRVNEVDGYGSLKTPFGTFNNTLRVKSSIHNLDKFIFDTGDTLDLSSILPDSTIEYKWFDLNYGMPLLTVTAKIINGVAINMKAEYIDSLRCLQPIPLFSYLPMPTYLDLSNDSVEVNFFSFAANCDSLHWDFGDAPSGVDNFSNESDPSHWYTSQGSYLVELIGCNSNPECSSLICDTFKLAVVVIDTSNVYANYIANPMFPCGSDTVFFTNSSVNDTAWFWDFDDGTTDTAETPVHIFSASGTYNVMLIASNDLESDTMYKSITVENTPVSAFTYSDTITEIPIQFNNTSSGIDASTSYLWTFTRGNPDIHSSELKNPQVTFAKSANADICLLSVNSLGCSNSVCDSVMISDPPPAPLVAGCGITATCSFSANSSVSGLPIGCFGDSTGALELEKYNNTIPAGIFPFCFEWRIGSETGTILSSGSVSGVGAAPVPAGSGLIDSLPAGTYVLVTYNSASPNCKNIKTQPVDQPSSVFSANLTSTSPPSCAGTCLNSATADGAGGTPPYYFNWSNNDIGNGVTSSTTDSLCTGNYDVTITDVAGCDTLINFSIGVSPLPIASAGPDKLRCDDSPGVPIGGSPTASSGTSPYTYSWSSALDLSSGTASNPVATPATTTTFTVTVSDINNCIGTDNVIVTVNPAINIALSQIDIACFGDSTGVASASASGGTSPFSYVWNSNPSQANDTAINLPIGTYVVTVTDDSACTAMDSVTITQPTLFAVTLSISSPPACAGTCQNTATASGSGGTQPYDFVWSTPQTNLNTLTSSALNLCMGNYFVTVTDANGCDTVISFTITESPLPIANAGTDKLICDGGIGVTIGGSPTASGGTSPYSYSWSNGVTLSSSVDSNPTASPSGTTTYSVTVTDANNCQKTDNVIVMVNPPIDITITGSDVRCFSENTGYAPTIVAGGTSPYSYLWSTVPPQSNDTAQNLVTGTYFLTVTDDSTCTEVDSVTITQPTLLTVSISSIQISCNGTNDGSATANPSGGTTAYSYLWSNGQSTKTINMLSPGTYCVTVTDANGCDTSSCITLVNPAPIATNFIKTNVVCNGACDGTASISPSGGTTPHTIVWNPGAFSSDTSVSGLCPGDYSVTVFDFSGCNTTVPFTITEPSAILPNTSSADVSCSGECDGQIISAPTGGTSPYTFDWSNDSVSSTVTGLCAGIYPITVTDVNGCTSTGSATINSPSPVSINLTAINATCPTYCNGTASVAPSGGVSPYTISWSTGAITDSISLLCSATYDVTVTDVTGCSISQSFTITAPATLNPNPTQTDLSCNGGSDGSACVLPSGGTSPFSYSWSCSSGTTFCATALSAGACTVTITDINGCIKTQAFTLSEPGAISTTMGQLNQTCSGSCDGIGSVSAAGGTSPYSYLWSAGAQVNDTAISLCGGNNTVTVTDFNSCQAFDTVFINSSIVIDLVSTIVTENCNSVGCDGTATATASGGASPYDFYWSSGDSIFNDDTALVSNLCQGMYFVSATDVMGCLSVDSIEMTAVDSVLQLEDSVINVSCLGNCDGIAYAIANGGTGSGTYSFSWPGYPDTDSLLENLCPGTYTGIVADVNGCRDTIFALVTEPLVLAASATGTNLSCNSSCTGTATASATGGNTPYTFLWSNGQTTQTAIGLCVDTFIVTVTDARGCNDTASIIITQPSALALTLSGDPVSCKGGADGSATALVTGGTSPYTYNWSVALATPVISGLTAGTYYVTVTDANSCSIIDSVIVSEPTLLTLSLAKTDVLCNGICNGTATASPSGGTSPYSYLWTGGQTSSTATGLCAGTVFLTVTDANNCTKTSSITISQPSALTISTSKTNVTCFADCDGTGTALAAGGTSPYTYLWSDGQNSQTSDSLCFGTYNVTATDANGCSVSGTVSITQPLPVSAIPVTTSSNCGVCDGTARFNVSGGSPAYTHSWSNGQTTATITSLCAGIFSDTIRDNNGCMLTATLAVSDIDGPDGATIITDNATCFGTCNGKASIVAVSGGSSPFSYLWSDSGTDTVMTGICSSTDFLTITDAIGCKRLEPFVIDEPDSLEADISETNATCFGLSDGMATSNSSGGSGSFTYIWSTGATGSSVTGLASGSYSLTVTDENGCTVFDTAVIADVAALALSLSAIDVLCNGDSTGTIAASPSGGTTPFSYSWNNFQSSSTAIDLPSGIYSVTVTDNYGCQITGSDTISESDPLSLSSVIDDATCGLSDGSIIVSASGGNSPYTYFWIGLGQNGASATGLSAGTYSVSVTDANSCTTTFDIGVNNVTGPGTSGSVTNTSCNSSCDGTGTVTITSGVSPFTYLWVPGGQTSASVAGLCAGDYNIEVTDGNNCTTVQKVTVSEPSPVSASFSRTNVSCTGVCDGTATVTGTGGIIPYTYLWSTGEITQFVDSLCDGTYSVSISDGNGCSGIRSITITEPSVLTASASGSTVDCNGDCDGTAIVIPSGGTPGYSYTWSSGASGSLAASLCNGSYTATVTDANGCVATATASVTQPGGISLTALLIETTCGNCSGTITTVASGGTSPYSRLWSNGSSTSSISSLCPNIYSITVTDSKGCSADSSFIMNNSDGPIPVLTGDTTTCFSDCDGTATSSTSGGTTPYTYVWNSGETTQNINSKCDGAYEIFVTDVNGCIGIGTTTISEPLQLLNTLTYSDADCNSSNNVTAFTSVSGGRTPYTYNWSNSQTGSTATGLGSGTFYVTVNDASSCIRIDSIVIDETSTLALAISGTNSNCFNSCDGLASAVVAGGASPYSYSWSMGGSTAVITNLCNGTYTVTVTDNNGCIKIDSVSITEPGVLSATISGTDVNCSGGDDGSATVNATGGTTPYSYNWSPSGQTDTSAIGLSSGTHSITVSDGRGCTFDTSVTINQPSTLTLDSVITINTACGDTNGSATAFVSGGESPYSWQWSNSDNTQTADSLVQGSYSVTVTYNAFCDTFFSGVFISNTDGPVVLIDSTGANCEGSCDGSATANVSAGTSPYSYLWSNSQTDSAATGLCAGTINLTVTDALGCITLSTVSIDEPTLLDLDSVFTDITCFGDNNGSASVTPSGGTSPYYFLWSNGASTQAINSLSAGNYCVTVTDDRGCDTSICVTISEPALLSLVTSFSNANCFGICDGIASVSPSGGISPYTYSWSNGQTGSSSTGLCDGIFTVTITDSNSCTVDTSFIISEPLVIAASFTQSQPACSDSNGALIVNVSGGTPFSSGNSYLYLWNDGQADSSATGLAAGTYIVTVTDSLGCTSIFTQILSNLNGPVVSIDSVDSVSCSGFCDGAIFISTTGVNSPFTYNWNNGQTTEDATNLCAGSDTLIVTDTAGCFSVVDTMIFEPVLLSATITSTNSTCGDCNANATATVSGGTSPYTYDWLNPQTTSTVTGLCEGNDSVVVTDENGCTATANTAIIDIAGPTDINLILTDATCFDTCNGSANASVVGGTSPFNYSWSNGQTGSSATALCSGNITVTITDSNSCVIDSSIIINQPLEIVSDSIIVVDASCGFSSGSITIFPSGGTSPYTFLWSNGQSNSSATGLLAGGYAVTITDGNGCEKVFSGIIVNNISGPVFSASVNDVNCNGLCDGSITISIISGTPPISYLWSNGDPSSFTDSLCSGNYLVTVTDSFGCASIASYTINEPALLTATTSGINVTCNGDNDGIATVSGNGGSTPYTFIWNTGSTNDTITNLSAGNYCVTLTDINGCDTVACVTIVEPPAISLSTSSNNVTCNASCNGDASVTASGGISPYSYQWSNSDSGTSADSLCAGNTTLTVTDANGCTINNSILITQPNAIVADSIVVVDANCLTSNGSATIFISGGTSPYTYSWANFQTNPSNTGLFAGNYSVTVTDSNSCSQIFSNIIVNNINGPTVSTSVTDVSCNGNCTGTMTATASGGTPPYGFAWSTGDTIPFTNPSIMDSLCTGIYSVTVVDFAGCGTIATDTVNEPPALVATPTSTNISCNGAANGTAGASVSGGTSPYSYLWSNGETSSSIDSLAAGNYCVTVTDSKACTDSFCITITEPATQSVSFFSDSVSCNSLCDGSATAVISGGTTPYSYSWSNGDSSTNADSLCAGTYSLTATDFNGCIITGSVTINEPSDIVADSIIIVDASCTQANGSITLYVSGGYSPYTYLWSTGQTNSSLTGLAAASYSVDITDANACTKTFALIQVSNINGPTVSTLVTDVSCNGLCNGSVSLTVSGISPFTYVWSNAEISPAIDTLCEGVYSVTVTDSLNCSTISTDTVDAPQLLTASTSGTNISCNGANDGMATVNAAGGSTPYTFLWSNFSTNDTITSLSGGNYCVTITDGNGCDTIACVFITEPAGLSLTLSSNNATCNGSCNGSSSAIVSGGTSPFTIQWSNGESGLSADSLCAGTTILTVTDAGGCSITDSISLTEPNSIVSDSIVVVDANCLTSNGSATIFVSGGVSPYSYVWSNTPQTTASITGIAANNYSVTVTDSLSCSKIFTNILVNNINGPSVSTAVTDVSCSGECLGTITATASGGIPPYGFVWSTGDTIPFTNPSIIDSLCTGIFFVTVVDGALCGTIASDTVNEPQALVAAVNSINISCNGSNDGSANLSISGGTSPYSFLWSNGETGSSIDSLIPGIYCITVTDANACSDTACITITQPSALAITLSSDSVSCNSLCDASALAVISGGTSPYIYTWSNGDNSSVADSLCAGTYSITASDINVCSISGSVIITQPAAIISDSISTVSPACGDSTGTATIYASGGVGPFSYLWAANANNQATQTATGLEAGTYSFTVTDSTGCKNIFTANISNQGAQTVSLSITDISCGGICNGSAVANVNGGLAPYSYVWSNDSITDNIDSLCAGVYSVTVTDAASCVVFASDTVNAGNLLSGTMSPANILCYGDSSGTISTSITGGSTPYTYSWDNGQTGSAATGLIAGNYCVTVSDTAGCVFTGCDTVGQPDSAMVISIATTSTTCSYSCDGTASASVTGGTSPYSYSWCEGSINPAIITCAITCSITITDANNCASVMGATIPAAPAIVLSDSITPPTCGSTNGSISVNSSGGTPFQAGYLYLWDNSSLDSTISGLSAGIYCVTVLDSTGCIFDTCYTLTTAGTALVTVDSIDNPDCYGACNGKIYISVTGSGSPFSYLWSNGDIVQDADSLCNGTYFLTVTDSLGCTTTFDTIVTEPVGLNASLTISDASCGLCDGTASISATGGTSPYTYNWSNNTSGFFTDSLCAGIYIVSVTDDKGCATMFSAPISNLGGPDSVSFSLVNLNCFGSCDGSASATVYGGTSPFSYLWSTSEITPTIADLCAGPYTLSITDSSGCLFIADIDISQPDLIDVLFTSTIPSCGTSDGSITANATGGTPSTTGYYYEWSSNVNGQTTANVTGLGADIFFVTITDSIGCSGLFSTALSNSDAKAFITVVNATCAGECNGSLKIDSITGTNFPFNYSWMPVGGSDSSIYSLCAGNYILEITDALGCITFLDTVVSEPSELTSVFSLTATTCGQCNGQAVITVSGGNTPYNYLWTNNQTTNTASGLCSGVYSAEVTDTNGCQATFSADIDDSGSPDGTISNLSNASCFGECDGAATVLASGGVTPYSYFWVGSSDTTNNSTDLCAGDHFVEIKGGNGCINIVNVVIDQPAGLADSAKILLPTCSGNNGSIEVFISGGISPYDYAWSNANTTNSVTGITAGIYILTVTDNNGSGCSQVYSYTLNSDSAPSLSISIEDASCFGTCNGQATVTATGGSGSYTYRWLEEDLTLITGEIGPTVSTLCEGTYFAQVKDSALCVSSILVEIGQPLPMDTGLINSTGNLCFGDCNGTATAVVNGGTLPYKFLWNNAQITNPATDLCSGFYTVIISDSNNCTVSQLANITQPAQITADTNSVTDALCFDSNNGAINISPGGGTSPFTFIWSGPNAFSSVSKDISNLLPGLYSLTVTDKNSCDTIITVVVDTLVSLQISSLKDTSMCEKQSVMLLADATGSSTINYSWSPANLLSNSSVSNPIANPTTTTEFTLTVSINGQCSVTDSMVVVVNDSPEVEAGDGTTIVKGVTAIIGGNPTASGGNTPYSYSWAPSEGLDDSTIANPVALPGKTTWYTVTVTTANGCYASDSVEVTVVPLIEYISGFSPNGDGINETWQIAYVEQFPEIDVEIYNRWGQLLYKSHGYQDPWDGTYNGEALPIGTYYYIIVLNHPKFPDPIGGPVTILK